MWASSSGSQGSRPAQKPAGTAAFSKFVHLLRLVAASKEPVSVAELAQQSGYPRATVHRTAAGLLAEGLLAESILGKGYVLGPGLISLASQSWGGSELRLIASEDLTNLRDCTGETVHLAVPGDRCMIYIEKLESLSAVRLVSGIGARATLNSTAVGKAYLAFLPASEREFLLDHLEFHPRMPNTIMSADKLRGRLNDVRERGWATDDEENEPGVQCFGAPILNGEGYPIAAVSVSTLKFRQQPDLERVYVEPLLATCRAIEQRIGRVPVMTRQVSLSSVRSASGLVPGRRPGS
ncbi:MAG: IclR family transcriptional regulator [Castellaniella sp.]